VTLKKDSGIEWIGDIPQTWRVKPLYAVGNQVRSKNNSGSQANLLSLSYGEIKEKDIDATEGLLPESFDTYQEIKPGDLVFRFTDLQNDKRSLRSAVNGYVGIITSAYLAFRPESIDSKYLGYLMRFYDTTKVFYSMGSGLRQSLKYSDVRRMPILLPPRDEQKAIVDFLDRELADIDELIAKQEKLTELVNERLRVFLLSFFDYDSSGNGKATGESNEWYRGVPTGWAVKRVSEVSKLVNGFPFDSESFSADEQGMPLVRIRDLIAHEFETFVPSLTVPESALVKDGDLLIGMDGDFNVKLWDRGEAALNQRVCLLRCDKPFVTKFLSFALPFALKRINELTYATTVKHLSSGQVSKIKIPLPPESELSDVCQRMQREIGQAQDLTKQSQDLITLSKERRSAIISAAVTGKIDIRGKY